MNQYVVVIKDRQITRQRRLAGTNKDTLWLIPFENRFNETKAKLATLPFVRLLNRALRVQPGWSMNLFQAKIVKQKLKKLGIGYIKIYQIVSNELQEVKD